MVVTYFHPCVLGWPVAMLAAMDAMIGERDARVAVDLIEQRNDSVAARMQVVDSLHAEALRYVGAMKDTLRIAEEETRKATQWLKQHFH